MSRWNDQLIDAEPSPGDIVDAERAAAVARVRHRLEDIRDWYALLAAEEPPPDAMAEMGELSRRLGKVTYDGGLPAGPIKRTSSGPPVSGSRGAPAPITDVTDLLGRANTASVGLVDRMQDPEDRACQIGHIAVASELDFWVCDWSSRRGEHQPAPVVGELTAYLADRLEWAYDHHGAWDEMAAAMERVARALYGTLTPREGRSVPVSAPCPREGCEGVLSRRDDGWVECGADECGRILSATEYVDWSGMVIARLAHDTWGISAKEISLRHGKPMGTVHRLAHKHAWRRTGKEHRPVMYDKRQVETTMALVAEREAEIAKAA